MEEEKEKEDGEENGKEEERPSRFGDDEIRLIRSILDSGRLSGFYKNFSGGRYVQEFEEAFREYHDMDYAVSTSSGTSALHTAYLACGIGPGDEVITTPYTFSATASMILACGARPVFADVDPLTYNLDPEKAWDSLTRTPATKAIKAIVPVHLLGHPCEMDTFSDIRDHKGLVVIEDAAQALGARYGGELIGTLGDVACFSFQETKQVSCGEGGMILTNDREIAERARAIRNHGEKYGDKSRLGYNYRLTEIQAAIGLCQFKKLEFYNNWQIRNAEYLASLFKEIPGLRPPRSLPHIKHVYSIFGAQFHPEKTGVTRTHLIEELTRLGYNKSLPGETIGPGYGELVYQLPCLSGYAANSPMCSPGWTTSSRQPCPIAEGLLKTALWIDLVRWPNTIERMDELVEAIHRILGEIS